MLKLIVTKDEAKGLKQMLERKRELFSDYKRMMIDNEITKALDGYHLSVLSTTPSKEYQKTQDRTWLFQKPIGDFCSRNVAGALKIRKRAHACKAKNAVVYCKPLTSFLLRA